MPRDESRDAPPPALDFTEKMKPAFETIFFNHVDNEAKAYKALLERVRSLRYEVLAGGALLGVAFAWLVFLSFRG